MTTRVIVRLFVLHALVVLAMPRSQALTVAPDPVEWVLQFGTESYDDAQSVATTKSGDIYVAGRTGGSLGSPNLGGFDAFVTRVDLTGQPVWTRQFGSPNRDDYVQVAADNFGNVYVAGASSKVGGTGTHDPYDLFLVKFTENGDRLWSRVFESEADEKVRGLVVDREGSVYVAGSTTGSIAESNAGGVDVVLMKLDSEGEMNWARQFGTSATDNPHAIALDGRGNILLSGTTGGDLEGSNAGSLDAFVAKYSPQGTRIWTKQLGGELLENGFGLAVESDGSAYVGLQVDGGGRDGFLSKLDGDGEELWTEPVDTTFTEETIYGVATDIEGSVFAFGRVYDSPVDEDIFLTQFNAAGQQIWAQQMGSAGVHQDWANDIAGSESGQLVLVGRTHGDWGAENAGLADIFVLAVRTSEPVPEPGSVWLALCSMVLLCFSRRLLRRGA